MKIKTTLLVLAAALAAGCAKQGMPSGGNKDVTPPQTRRMSPPNGTLNRQVQNFYIEFDEYVVIKDAENNILISPPMKQSPDVKTKGKGIKVTIKDTLLPNTTYLFQFKEAIADFNEGNLLPSMEYVFSTGNYIDSMMLKGNVVDALTLEPDKELVKVWLLDDDRYRQAVAAMSDTNVAPPQPNYSTRTDKGGLFCFNNIKPGDYHIIAIKDEDKNNVVGNNETVAFVDTTTAAVVMPPPPTADTATAADTSRRQETAPSQKMITLRLSTLKNERQRLTGSNFVSSGKAVITSLLPLTEPHLDAGGEKFTWRLNSSRDTLTLWTLRKECDSLQLIVNDTSGINDTLRLKWHSRKRQSKGALLPPPKSTEMRMSTSSLPYYDTLALLFTTPLDTSKCSTDSVARIMLLKDSTIESCNATIDSTSMKVRLLYTFRQGEKYAVDVIQGRFTDIYGLSNDSLHASVNITKAEDYGNLAITVDGEGDMIVELLDEGGKVLKKRTISGSDKIMFPNLKPAKYRVRAIVDSNGNGVWDAGDFATQRQPEKVVYLDKILDVRANWDFEERLAVE